MQPNFLSICSYFAPLIFTSLHLGFGSTVFLTSHIESAATSVQFTKTLMENYEFKEAEDEDLSAPSDEEVRNFFESLAHKSIECNKFQVIEALQFFFKAFATANKTVIEIASEAMSDDSNDPSAIFKKSAFMDNGKKSDIYGYLQMMRNVAYESASQSVNQRHLLSKKQLENLSHQKIESMFTAFKTNENFAGQDEASIEDFIKFLNSASKRQLRMYGIDGDSHVFQHREEYASEVSDTSFDSSNAMVAKFIRFVIKTIKDETNVIEHKKSELDNYIVEVVKDSKTLISNYLSANPINYAGINAILIETDKHFRSAAQTAIRVNNFIYGSELAPYPKFLVREVIVKNDYAYLERLTAEHADGIRGVYAKDQEEIFVVAYQKDKSERNNWKWIKLLCRTGFDFSDDQKKALFRDIINSNDSALLRLMVDNRRLNLFEYQKDRGITFYHLLLIEGSDELLDHVHSNYIIEEPQLKVKFIPNYPFTTDEQSPSCPYWLPHENNFRLELKNFDLPGMKIRKNWDFLMIAAAAGHVKIASTLISRNADITGYEKIKEHFRDQNIIASIIEEKKKKDSEKK